MQKRNKIQYKVAEAANYKQANETATQSRKLSNLV